jgi:hypothetical protein
MNELIDEKKLTVLLERYKEHAAHIRHLDNFDVRIFGGFITLQLALASWFAVNPIHAPLIKLGVIAVNAALLLVAFFIISGSRNRRKEVVQVIWNISEALGLDRAGTYLAEKPINPPPHPRRFWWYEIGCIIGFVGTTIVLCVSLQ